MHLFGKILVWLTIPTAIVAMVFMSRMIQVRNQWTGQVEKLEKDNQQTEVRLVELRKELDDVRKEYDLVALAWNSYWDGVDTSAPQGDTNLVVARLSKAQIAQPPDQPEPPVLHLFETVGEDASRYVGPFQATTIDENSQFKPTWRLRPGDAERWNAQNVKWRWRTLIPPSYTDRFVDAQDRLIRADQLREDRDKNLEIQSALLAAAEARLKENLQNLGLEQEVGQAAAKGLIDQVASAEDARNSAWHELDRLRRGLNAEVKRRATLSVDNRRLMQQLPQPAKSDSPAKPGVAAKDSTTN